MTPYLAARPRCQKKPQLFASLVRSKGFVAGAKLAASGLYQFGGDTTWGHIGWNNPRVYGFSFDPTNPEIIFLACGNGALRTLDGGKSWRITTDWRVTEALAVCVDRTSSKNVYLATAYGIWRTTDRGETWTESNQGLKKRYTQTVIVDRTQTKRILAGTEGGLYVSTDGAKSWSLTEGKAGAVLDIQQSVSSPHIWLAGTQRNGVLRSKDRGRTWVKAEGGIAQSSIYAVAIDRFNDHIMAAAGWNTGVFVSENGGRSWSQHKAGLPTSDIYELVFDASESGKIWTATVEEGIFTSDDLGKSWHYNGLFGALVFDMKFHLQKRE